MGPPLFCWCSTIVGTPPVLLRHPPAASKVEFSLTRPTNYSKWNTTGLQGNLSATIATSSGVAFAHECASPWASHRGSSERRRRTRSVRYVLCRFAAMRARPRAGAIAAVGATAHVNTIVGSHIDA